MFLNRLNLPHAFDFRKAILMNSVGAKPVFMKDLPEDTAKFFIKAPDNNVLEFVLSNKVILVEGDAEFILFDALYKKQPGNSTLEKDGVHVISVGGTSFKRYLDLAKLLGMKTAIVRDNDGDYQKNCVNAYADYVQTNTYTGFSPTMTPRCGHSRFAFTRTTRLRAMTFPTRSRETVR